MWLFVLLWDVVNLVAGAEDGVLGREAQPATARVLSVSRQHKSFFIRSSFFGLAALSVVYVIVLSDCWMGSSHAQSERTRVSGGRHGY